MSETSSQAADWQPDPTGRHQLRYWDGQQWTDHVSDNGQQSDDPFAATTAAPGMPSAPAAPGTWARGPVGSTTNIGMQILLTIVTLGIWAAVWTYRQFEDFKKYSGEGMGGGVGLVLYIFIWPVVMFLMPNELNENIYKPEGETCPVSAVHGLWFLLPIVGWIIWYVQVQNAINDFWVRRGAPAP